MCIRDRLASLIVRSDERSSRPQRAAKAGSMNPWPEAPLSNSRVAAWPAKNPRSLNSAGAPGLRTPWSCSGDEDEGRAIAGAEERECEGEALEGARRGEAAGDGEAEREVESERERERERCECDAINDAASESPLGSRRRRASSCRILSLIHI